MGEKSPLSEAVRRGCIEVAPELRTGLVSSFCTRSVGRGGLLERHQLPQRSCTLSRSHVRRGSIKVAAESRTLPGGRQERKRKEKAEAHLYTMVKIARDADIKEQIGTDVFFDLIDHDKVIEHSHADASHPLSAPLPQPLRTGLPSFCELRRADMRSPPVRATILESGTAA
jgi:hypothetical protein